jgi:hypothetical protein
MALINELKWMSLTTAINEMKSPNTFIKNLLFSDHQTQPLEDIQVDTIDKAREVAPLVRKNGEAIFVGGYTSSSYVISPPNIRIKRAFSPSELLFGRRPGTVVYNPTNQMSAARQHIARDMQVMADMITNAEEYLASLALVGTISYEVDEQEVFTLTQPRPDGHNVTLDVYWDDATPGDVVMHADIHAIKRLINDAVGLSVTDAILGTEAADAFLLLASKGNIEPLNAMGHVKMGQVDLTTQFRADGVIYLGNIAGVDFWEYGRTASVNGVSTSMIRAKYAEFFSRSSAAQRVLYYGAIADMDTFEGRNFQAERFSKSWKNPDPSAQMVLAASRPLPWIRRPGAHVSAKVVSG